MATPHNPLVPQKQSPPPPDWTAGAIPMPKPTVDNQGNPFGMPPPIPLPKPTVDNQGVPFGATPATGSQPLVPPTGAPKLAQAPVHTGATSVVGSQAQGQYAPVRDEAQIGLGFLNEALSADSALMRNARTTGIETAAARGLHNSSIAAGAAQRAALDAAMPVAQMAMDQFGQRENRQWQTGEREAQQQWTSTENQLDRDQQITMSEVTNWLNNETFMREFNAQLAMFPINNTTQLLNYITQQAMDNPEVYTPDVISGMSEFFTTNFLDVISRYFPGYFERNAGGQP